MEIEIRRGLLLRRCAFAAINTGVSVIPLASFAMVLPVHGKSTRISNRLPGPIGSASEIVKKGSLPVISCARFKKSFDLPKRLSIVPAASEKMVCTRAPSSVSF